ncbi:Ig-like domain-containing protein [Halovenus salina]|uniref:Ig-like domain-containing protein n=1 Tax=Halovenus salina TaxID=1510225 RepID=A0ABD5W7S3_9EURY|nr:Ig-like domain-containing protein [Halovenus salina]
MRFLRDDRGQAIQIGAVLIFGLIVVFLALYQGFVVPNQNEEIEFNHNQQLQSELTDMRSAIISMPGETTTRSVSVGLGLRYPSRAVFVNPGPVSGTLRTSGTTDEAVNLTIENATASGEIGDFWNDTAAYNTGAIEYRPGYNIFASAPRTAYEHSVLYNDFGENTTLPITDQSIVDGNRITLVTLNGTFSQSRIGDTALDFEPVSTETRRVEIFNQSSPITLKLPTRMNESEWEAVFDEEMNASGGNVKNISETALPGVEDFSLLEVTLKPGTYSLRMAKVGFGTNVEQTREAYLTDIEGDGAEIQTGETQTLTLEVRDEFNKPIGGVTVNGSAENGNFTGPDSKTVTKQTDSEGQVTVEYEARNTGNNAINFTIEAGYQPSPDGSHAAGTKENVTMTVQVNDPPESVGGGNGTSAFDVEWLDPDPNDNFETECDNKSCTLNYTEAQQLDLTLNTTAQNAPVDFAVSNSSVGTLNRSNGTTDSNGEVPVTFQPQANGTVDVYGWTGGGGDSIEITVKNYQQGNQQLGLAGKAVFVKKGGSGKVQLANSSTTTELGGNADIIGPFTTGLDSDNLGKIPYINGDNDEIRLINEGGNDELLMDGVGLPTQKSLLAVGDWDGNPTSVYFADSNRESIYRQDKGRATDNPELVLDDSNGDGVRAVLGVADITGDGDEELVFENDNDKLSYLKSENGSPTEITITGRDIGENNAPGIGRPADFNNDGEARIPVVDGNNNLVLVASDGTATEIVSGDVTKAPIAPVDWDDDGDLEIVYLDGNDLKYVDNPLGSAQVSTISTNTASDSAGVT